MVEYSRERKFDHGRQGKCCLCWLLSVRACSPAVAGWDKFDHSAAGDAFKNAEAPIKAVKRDV